ncbi:MAG: hypothetical protein AAF550_10495 [Myxococcota bacterium]
MIRAPSIQRRRAASGFYLYALALQACGDLEEVPRVELPVVVDPGGIERSTSDLGYEVMLTGARAMIENLAFTIAGEAHARSLRRHVSDLFVSSAYAHPGHFQGGDVTGEFRGRFQLNWLNADAPELGRATLLVGTYASANFTFIQATEDDGLAVEDPLLGHTAVLEGVAMRDARAVAFTAIIDSPEGRELVGAPFEFEVRQSSTEQLGIRLLTLDPFEGDTLFDGVDFFALDEDADGSLRIDAQATSPELIDAYNRLRRTFQTHDHFSVDASQRE